MKSTNLKQLFLRVEKEDEANECKQKSPELLQQHPVPIITRSPRHYKRRVRFRLTPANVLLVLAVLAALALLIWGAHEATDMILSYADDVSGVIG